MPREAWSVFSASRNPCKPTQRRSRGSGKVILSWNPPLVPLGPSLSCLLLREAGAPFPSQLGPQVHSPLPRLCPRGGYIYLLLCTWLGHGAGSVVPPRSTLSLRVGFALFKGRSSAGAGGGGEDDATCKTPRSGRSWMARPGPGDPSPPPRPPSRSRRAGLRSSAWARQRASGVGAEEGREPGSPARAAAGRSRPAGLRLGFRGSDGWPGNPDSGTSDAQWSRDSGG